MTPYLYELLAIIVVLSLLSAFYFYVADRLGYWWERSLKATIFVIGIILGYSLIYQWGMAMFEGAPKSYIHSVQVVIESLTTAGYGGDSPWVSDFMNLFVVFMNLTGVVLVFMAFPLLVLPMIREAIQTRPPEKVNLENHIIICSNSTRATFLKDELVSKSIPYVIIDVDEDTVIDLNEDGIKALLGNPSDREVLSAANISEARAVIADMEDEMNALITLTARSLNKDVRILSIATNENVVAYHRYAGANQVILPRRILGQSLAEKAIVSISEDLQGVTQLSSQLELTEILVEPNSDIAGKTIKDSGIRERFGVNIIGTWTSGNFEANPKPDQVITEHTILLLAGSHEQLTNFHSKTKSKLPDKDGPVIIAGMGVVGKTIAEIFRERDIEFVVVDLEQKEGVDIVGDITHEDVLKRAGIEDASAIILAVNDDAMAIFTTLIIAKTYPNTEIIARVSDANSINMVYRAGADYVLSLPTVSGRMLFSILEETDEVLSTDTMYEVVRTRAPQLAGQSLEEANIRKKTGCTVVAVEREEQLLTNLKPNFEIEKGDQLIVVGSDETINKFRSYYC